MSVQKQRQLDATAAHVSLNMAAHKTCLQHFGWVNKQIPTKKQQQQKIKYKKTRWPNLGCNYGPVGFLIEHNDVNENTIEWGEII